MADQTMTDPKDALKKFAEPIGDEIRRHEEAIARDSGKIARGQFAIVCATLIQNPYGRAGVELNVFWTNGREIVITGTNSAKIAKGNDRVQFGFTAPHHADQFPEVAYLAPFSRLRLALDSDSVPKWAEGGARLVEQLRESVRYDDYVLLSRKELVETFGVDASAQAGIVAEIDRVLA